MEQLGQKNLQTNWSLLIWPFYYALVLPFELALTLLELALADYKQHCQTQPEPRIFYEERPVHRRCVRRRQLREVERLRAERLATAGTKIRVAREKKGNHMRSSTARVS